MCRNPSSGSSSSKCISCLFLLSIFAPVCALSSVSRSRRAHSRHPAQTRAVLKSPHALVSPRVFGRRLPHPWFRAPMIGASSLHRRLHCHQHVHDFQNQKDVDLAAMCEVYQPRLEEGLDRLRSACAGLPRFWKLLDNKDIQAVVVSTPNQLLARAAHHHGLLSRQRRLCRKADDPVHQRGPLDGYGGTPL